MESRVNGVLVNYVEHGEGIPLIALHGVGVDHREIETSLEAIVPKHGYRRIYPDLPGMGRSTADGLGSNEEVLTLLAEFIDQLDAGPVLVLGHSYGAYLARGLAARRPANLRGLALVCPLGEGLGDVPEQSAVVQDAEAYEELEPQQHEGFDDYFVVRTAENARRYRDVVVPGNRMVDHSALERIFANWTIDLDENAYEGPTLVVAGRRDSTVGYADALGLLTKYPHATMAVLEDAGHALMHERPALLASLVSDWLARATRDSDGVREPD
jgi:pimeloyl-ACP methyl ester carboxylesterase